MTIFAESQKNKSALEYATTMSPHIRTICNPLFSNLDFSGFAHIKIFPNNKMLHLTSDSYWSKEYFEREFYNKNDCFENFRRSLSENETKSLIITGSVRDEYTTWLYEFDIWNSCSIYKKHNDIIEGWAFGTHKKNKRILDFYLNKKEILNHFIYYFNEKVKNLLNVDGQKNLIILDKNIGEISSTLEEINLQEYLEKTYIKYFFIEVDNKEVFITKRELEYLTYLLRGYSTKGIALNMDISPRTAESYFDTIKNKMHLKNKKDVIAACKNSLILGKK